MKDHLSRRLLIGGMTFGGFFFVSDYFEFLRKLDKQRVPDGACLRRDANPTGRHSFRSEFRQINLVINGVSIPTGDCSGDLHVNVLVFLKRTLLYFLN